MFCVAEGASQGEEPVTRSCWAEINTQDPLSLCNNLAEEDLGPEL